MDLGDRHAAHHLAFAGRRAGDRRLPAIGRQADHPPVPLPRRCGGRPALARRRPSSRFEGQRPSCAAAAKAIIALRRALDRRHGPFAGFRGGAVRIEADEAGGPAGPASTDAFGRRLDAALREPIDRIVGQAEKLGAADEGPLAADYAGYAADIAAAGRHLLALVDDLVDLSAIERPDFRPAAEEIDLTDPRLPRRRPAQCARRRQKRHHRRPG